MACRGEIYTHHEQEPREEESLRSTWTVHCGAQEPRRGGIGSGTAEGVQHVLQRKTKRSGAVREVYGSPEIPTKHSNALILLKVNDDEGSGSAETKDRASGARPRFAASSQQLASLPPTDRSPHAYIHRSAGIRTQKHAYIQSPVLLMSWDATRRAVRSLEARLDSALSTASSTSGDLQTSLSAASSIPALLVDLRSANGQLSVALGSNPTPAQMAAVRRHDEVLGEYEREWSVVEGRRGRRDVLEGVRGDIR